MNMRRTARFSGLRTVLGFLWAAGLVGCGDPAKGTATATAPGIAGRYVATGPAGTSSIVLEENGADLVMVVDGDRAAARRTAEGRFEGKQQSAEGTVAFVLERRGDRIAAQYDITMADGQVHKAELVYSREGAAAGAAPAAGSAPAAKPAASAAGSRPEGLVGHWRFTEVIPLGDQSLVTDTNIVLDADGTCTTWTRTQDGGGEPKETGEWKVEGNRLLIRPPGGGEWNEAGTYGLAGDALRIVRPDGLRRVFSRQ